MTNDLAVIGFTDLQQMAATMARSGMFGKTADQMLSLMLIAQAEGLHPAIAAMEYDVIQNRPALKGQAALARFQQAGGVVNWITRTDTEATAQFIPPKGDPLKVTWNMEKAKRMGLADKDNWRKQPGVMLSWRCVAEGVRAVYPACLNRMYLAEEVQDFEPLKNVTPVPAADDTPPAPVVAPAIDWTARAAELTEKAGYNPRQKADLWKRTGCNAEAYCKALEVVLHDRNADAAKGDGDDFALTSDPSIDEIILELEEYASAETTPQTERDYIISAFARKVSDIAELSALLKRVKEACKA